MIYYQSTLSHHGIKGMRWGIRRTKEQLMRARGSSKPVAKKDPKKTTPTKGKVSSSTAKKSVKEMSDEELAKKVKRLELEKRYSDLDKSTTSKGKAFAMRVLERSGEEMAVQVSKHFMAEGINKALFDGNEIVFANNKKK